MENKMESTPSLTFEHILPETIFDAAERFGGRCTGRFLALNAMENRVYDIEREDGSHVVIKFYRPGRWSRETILVEHKFLAQLEKNEVPVVCPLRDEKGETLFEKDGVLYAVFPKTAGRLEPELNPEQLKRLGRFLARIHLIGEQFKTSARWTLTPTTYGRDSLQTLEDQNIVPTNLLLRLKQIVTPLCDLLDPMFAEYKPILLHGDCHCGNILWKGDNPFFIDFDDCILAPPVQDIWMLTGGDDEDGKKRKEVLIDAYSEIREFDERSLKLVEPLRALRMVFFNAWIARRWYDGAFKRTFPGFGTERYWQEQIEGLAVQWERVREGKQAYT